MVFISLHNTLKVQISLKSCYFFLFSVIRTQQKLVKGSAFLLSIEVKEESSLYPTLQKGIFCHFRVCDLKNVTLCMFY